VIKKVLVLVLLLAVTAGANDLRAIFSDSIVPADSGDVRADTVYTPAMDISGYSWLQFYTQIKAYENRSDTNFTDDSFFVYVQYSPDGIIFNAGDTLCIDTFLATGAGWSFQNLTHDDAILGNYMRGMLVHWDSIKVSEADSALVNRGSPFYKEMILWICGSKAK